MPILEVLQWRQGLAQMHNLLAPLQDCLRSCTALRQQARSDETDVRSNTPTGTAYASQLVLTALRRMVASDATAGDDSGAAVHSSVDIELVVRAVEHAASPQAEAAALELLAVAAQAAPEVTLDSVLQVVRIASAGHQTVCFHSLVTQ